MELKVYMKIVYGNHFTYPICENSKILASLTNKKTLSKVDILQIEKLGFIVKYELDPILTKVTPDETKEN